MNRISDCLAEDFQKAVIRYQRSTQPRRKLKLYPHPVPRAVANIRFIQTWKPSVNLGTEASLLQRASDSIAQASITATQPNKIGSIYPPPMYCN